MPAEHLTDLSALEKKTGHRFRFPQLIVVSVPKKSATPMAYLATASRPGGVAPLDGYTFDPVKSQFFDNQLV